MMPQNQPNPESVLQVMAISGVKVLGPFFAQLQEVWFNPLSLFLLLYMVHDEKANISCRDHLEYHCDKDKGRSPFWNFLVCCWKTIIR
jgi:hypothetical protein